MKNFNWRIFIITLLITVPVLFAADIALDYFKKSLDWKLVFGAKNIFLKVSCGIILGLFTATNRKEES